jgi:hypothetical protein
VEHEILVKGSGELRVAPDRAIVYLTVDADGSSREGAYEAGAESATRVDGVLAAHQSAIERTTTAALVVQPRTRWKKGEPVRSGWRAARCSTVEIVAFDQLGELLAELATAGATISGPAWLVDPANPAFLEVRSAAAADARRRAEAYASGLAMTLGAVRWMSEPGLREPAPVPGSFEMGRTAGFDAAGAASDDQVIDVSPEELTISAEIEVSFALAEL